MVTWCLLSILMMERKNKEVNERSINNGKPFTGNDKYIHKSRSTNLGYDTYKGNYNHLIVKQFSG